MARVRQSLSDSKGRAAQILGLDRGCRLAWLLLVLGIGLAGAVRPALAQPASASVICVVISGLGGMPEYEENFLSWAEKTKQLCVQLGADVHVVDARQAKRDEVAKLFDSLVSRAPEELWLFLIGHGNHDGTRFRFNIKGPDLTDADLKAFFEASKAARINLVAATSASGVLLPDLAAENRVVVTATRNQFERQPPLFYSFFVEAAGSPEADANKDGKVSLLEAFVFSREQVAAWYADQGRIQTEHAVLSDRGAQRLEAGKEEEEPDLSSGTGWLAASAYISRPPERAYRSLEAQELASQRARLERSVEDLKFRKGELPQEKYFEELEKLLVQLAEIGEQIERLEQQP